MTPLEALQETLAAEHVAVYTYGVVGGRLSAGSYPETSARFRSAYDAHRARRDQLRSLVSDRGADPEPAAAAYVVDAPDRSLATLTAAARRVELRCAEVYSQLVASSEDDLRRLAISLLTDASLRSVTFGAPTRTWPGAPDL